MDRRGRGSAGDGVGKTPDGGRYPTAGRVEGGNILGGDSKGIG